MTRVRGAGGSLPMTNALVALAADARMILGASTKITYGADWTEYGGIVPSSGELIFPLDALWASANIDMVGIDWYPPLSDWRDGADHADAEISNDVSEFQYLASRVASGEAFDWYYADDEDRAAQNRQPISDGAYGKPWVYRIKDLVNWWSNSHVARVGGVEIATTAWTPRSKPIWLTELGCPAVDLGANGPNAFPDVKSTSAALPPFSHGERDDLMAIRALQAQLAHFDPAAPNANSVNPVSPHYGGRMLDAARTHLWAWDARPFPAFPALQTVWGDAANYEAGHWLNGRLEGAPLDELVQAIARDFEIADLPCDGLNAFVDGFVIDRPMSLRQALEPLANLYAFGLRGGRLALIGGRRKSAASFIDDDLVADRDGRTMEFKRAQETELPAEAAINFSDDERDYRRASAASRRLAGLSRRQTQIDSAVVGRRASLQAIAETRLQDAWTARETVRFSVPPTMLALEPGDRVTLTRDGVARFYEIQRIVDGHARAIEAKAVDDRMRGLSPRVIAPQPPAPPSIAGPPHAITLELPIARGAPVALQYVAAFADPWPGALRVWRRAGDFIADRVIPARAMIGTLLDPLPPGALARWDRASACRVKIFGGALSSIEDEAAFAGDNLFAVQKPGGDWELLVAARAELVADKTWLLSRLLRGLGGSEFASLIAAPAGATIVRLNGAATPLAEGLARLGQANVYRIGPADIDHADPRVREIAMTASAIALKPFAPVHLSARREAGGVRLSWIRQTRVDGDAWDVVEVPLGEENERYEIDILAPGEVVKRTLASDAPHALYEAADELADFGAPQTVVDISVAQISAIVGRGFARRATLKVL